MENQAERRSTVKFAENDDEEPARPSATVNNKRKKCCKKKCFHLTPLARHLVVFGLLVIWIVLGTIAFNSSEYPEELKRIEAESSQTTNASSIEINLVNTTITSAIETIFSQFVTNYEIVNLTESTLVVRRISTRQKCVKLSNLHQWDLSGSLFFAITVVTAIGYGTYAPTTQFGRLACVIFATFGIPLCLIVINNQAKLLAKFSSYIARLIGRCTSSLRRHSTGSTTDVRQMRRRRKSEMRARKFASLLSTFIVSLSGIIVFLLLPSILFAELEDWDYVTAVYYSFVTLTTIGFGDLVAGHEHESFFQFYRIFLCLWIFLGIACVATFLQAIQSLIDKTTKEGVTELKRRISLVSLSSLARLSVFNAQHPAASRKASSQHTLRTLARSSVSSTSGLGARASQASAPSVKRLSARAVEQDNGDIVVEFFQLSDDETPESDAISITVEEPVAEDNNDDTIPEEPEELPEFDEPVQQSSDEPPSTVLEADDENESCQSENEGVNKQEESDQEPTSSPISDSRFLATGE